MCQQFFFSFSISSYLSFFKPMDIRNSLRRCHRNEIEANVILLLLHDLVLNNCRWPDLAHTQTKKMKLAAKDMTGLISRFSCLSLCYFHKIASLCQITMLIFTDDWYVLVYWFKRQTACKSCLKCWVEVEDNNPVYTSHVPLGLIGQM